jgi:uncharacterized tellurite resistance protein B-like protein
MKAFVSALLERLAAAADPRTGHPHAGARGPAAAPDVALATAVLLVEVARADTTRHAAETAALEAALRARFGRVLGEAALRELLALAEDRARDAHDFHAFTSALNDRLDDRQKLDVIEAMWDVAFADGHLAAHEQHTLWRVADLLHVQHGAYIGAKTRARERAAAAAGGGAPLPGGAG